MSRCRPHKKIWWTKTQTKALRELLVRYRLSRSQAAKIINQEFGTSFTRCAVVARAWRLGIKANA